NSGTMGFQYSSISILDMWRTQMRYNAALRGECRINQLSADQLHHQNSPHTKNATRHESLFNALLYDGR
ncbi:hypothetical protein, partial [Vibrio vulnificus]|uniref:hypothetical protein n=1 Tax=Vibrio vulnificus TaxID=672 RepID=UPI001C626A59